MLFTGHLDVAFLIIYLYPLLILAASADMTATARQSGTLRMMLTQAVPLRTIVLGKILARAALVAAVPLAVALAALAVTGADAATVQRLLLWGAAAVAYGTFWLGVSVLVNAIGRTGAAIALTLAGVWLCLIVLAPSIGNLATRLIYPVPSRVEFATEMRAATRDAMVQGSQMLGRFLEDHPSAGTGVEGMQQYALLQALRGREVAKRSEPLRAAYDRQLALQRRLMSALQYVSPAILMQLALTDIAGTSGDRHRRFHAQATDFQASWQLFFEPRLLAAEPLTADDFDRLPGFGYVEEPVADVVRRNFAPVTLLALAGVGLTLIGLLGYSRYDVTGSS
jgi:ABC-2 type transport system permease protein